MAAPTPRRRRPRAPGHPARGAGGGGGFPFLALAVLLGSGLVVGLWIGWHTRPPAPSRPAPSPAARAPHRAPSPGAGGSTAAPAHPAPAPPLRRAVPRPPRENPEDSQSPAVAPAPSGVPPGGAGRARVAVIFDDAGYSLQTAREVMALPRPVTISVLPGLPFSTPIAEEAARRGVQVILHLPVQPDNPGLALGPGGITVDMSDDAIAQTVASDFASVPGAVGTNNHMGSRGTADPRVMRAVLGVVKARRVFFIDSLTSPRSVAAETARTMGVPTAVRAVFLDNQDDETYVRGQFHALIRVSQTHGQAIAIGHVGKVTARVLREMLPEFDEAGIRFVFVSSLVH